MKKLLLFAILFVGLNSCQKEAIEIQEDEVISQENLDDISLDARSTWPKTAWELVDYLNDRNFTHGRYIDCNVDLISVNYSGGNSTNVDDPYGPLSARDHNDTYTTSDYGQIVRTLWDKVRAECPNAIITSVDFSVGFFTPTGDYDYYIDAAVTICCDPNLSPYEPPTPYPHDVKLKVG